jgi:hypothetical protein
VTQGGSVIASTDQYDNMASDIRQPGGERAGGILDVRELIRHATLAASSHNTQPWKCCIRRDSIVIQPDFSRRCPVVDPDDSHLFKSLGCATENLVHAAAAQGFAAEVQCDSGEGHVIVNLNRAASARATGSSAGVAVFVLSRADTAGWVEVEVRQVRTQFESWLNLKGEQALLMVRFGHGPTAPFSLRHPIDDVILGALPA